MLAHIHAVPFNVLFLRNSAATNQQAAECKGGTFLEIPIEHDEIRYAGA